ncbi:MAG: BppU family phage baseplate upper protein [Clostridia bacterium]|nr:BppU family phage baseplate upper protein [Clostridia bacterium]
MIVYKFSLELTKNGIQKRIHAKAGEFNSRKLVVTLTESGKIYNLDGLSADVFFDNGNKSAIPPERVNDTFEYVLPSGMLAKEGQWICELKITDENDSVIYSPMFEVVVEKSVGNVNTGDSDEVGVAVRYQEEITEATEEIEDLSDNDSFVVHDQTEKKVKRFPWENFIRKHDEDIHKNKSVIDKLSEENESLVFNGKKIAAESFTEPIVFNNNYDATSKSDSNLKFSDFFSGEKFTYSVYSICSFLLSEDEYGYEEGYNFIGKRVAKIEFGFYDANGDIKWVDIKSFNEVGEFYFYVPLISDVYLLEGYGYRYNCFGTISWIGVTTNKYLEEINNLNHAGFRVTFYND